MDVSSEKTQFYSMEDDYNISIEEWMNRLNVTDNNDSDWTMLIGGTWQTTVITLYAIVILFGFFLNLIVVIVIVRYRQLHTVTNIFICYLAIADVMLCVFNLPLQLHYQIRNDWIFGRILCYVAMPTFGVPMFSSSLAIMMIAIDRYMLIVYPFRRRMSNSQAIIVVIGILFSTVALSTPLFVYVKYVTYATITNKGTRVSCSEQWPSYLPKQVYAVSTFVLQFILPLLLTSFFYMHISYVLRNRPVKKQDTHRSQRTTRILIAVVLTFTICWLPWNLYALTAEFSHQVVRGKYFVIIDLILKVFAVSSACINPFLYGWLNDNFKKELGKLCGNQLCCSRSRQSAGPSYSRATDHYNGGVTVRTDVCTQGIQETSIHTP